MKPTCKLCETRHWTYEAHGSGSEKVREVGESVLGPIPAEEIPVRAIATVSTYSPPPPPDVAPVTQKTCNACNKPFNNRGKVCNACRQKAYRERSRG